MTLFQNKRHYFWPISQVRSDEILTSTGIWICIRILFFFQLNCDLIFIVFSLSQKKFCFFIADTWKWKKARLHGKIIFHNFLMHCIHMSVLLFSMAKTSLLTNYVEAMFYKRYILSNYGKHQCCNEHGSKLLDKCRWCQILRLFGWTFIYFGIRNMNFAF